MKKIFLILPFLLIACSPDTPNYVERPPETIFAKATEYLEDINYPASAVEFIEIERQHPSSDLAARGSYMAGYAYYKGKSYGEAIDILDHFIKLHPAHPNADYALYLKSMCYFDQISDIRREQKATVEALATMLLLKEQFPESRYTKNVEKKILLLKNFLAGKEMFIARKLLEDDNLLGALKRFQIVVKSFGETTMRAEALYRMIEIYKALHLEDKSAEIYQILQLNHPDSEWTIKASEILLHD